MSESKIENQKMEQQLITELPLIDTTSSQPFINTLVMRRLFDEMVYEKNMVNGNTKYTVSYKEGYEEAVRCMGVVIKQLIRENVRNGA